MRELLAETSEAWEFRARNGRLPLAGVEEISPTLEALRDSGGAAGAEDFRPILAVARAAEAVRRALSEAESPRLVRRRDAIPGFIELIGQARRLFDADGAIRDDASSELHDARSKLRRRRSEVSRSLSRIVDERRDFLGDAVVVLRNDRYCLPVLASARSRVPGIVHDRSGSGQTVFVEPLDVIESNNELALLAAEERREVERLLAAFGQQVLDASEDLEDAVAQMAALDALEAKVEFGEVSRGRLPEISDNGGWTLSAARHPLLDPALAPLRSRALAEARPARAAQTVVPLDFELPAQKRLLVVSGPNAGGKTVVLKTAGLFSLMAQAGLPLPCGPATRVPVFRAIRAEIGDAQEILAGRSTFSSSMETLAAVLGGAGDGSLALIDEIGGSTDPEEGSALAIAFIEEYLSRGGRILVTTHFSALKNFAAVASRRGLRGHGVRRGIRPPQLPAPPRPLRQEPRALGRAGAGIARGGAPPRAGDPGRSVAPAGGARIGGGSRDRETPAVGTGSRGRTRKGAARGADARQGARDPRGPHARMLEEGLAGFERARADLARRVEEEIAAIRQDASRRAEASAPRLVARAEAAMAPEPVIEEAREEALDRTRELAAGDQVRVRGSKTSGVVASLDHDTAWLDVAGKRMRVRRSELERVAGKAPAPAKAPASLSTAPKPEPVSTVTLEINVIGQRIEDAIPQIEKSLDEALLSGAAHIRIVHGHGTGRLREAVREHFRDHPAVASLRAGEAREGGNGATIVVLK